MGGRATCDVVAREGWSAVPIGRVAVSGISDGIVLTCNYDKIGWFSLYRTLCPQELLGERNDMSEMKSSLVVPSPPRRWYQRRLQLLLIFVTFCAIPCIWLTVKMRREPATMTFDLQSEIFDEGPPESNFKGEVRVRAREGDRLMGATASTAFTVVEIIDKDHVKIRIATGLRYDSWSDDEERRKANFHCLATDNEVVIVRRGETLEARTNSICGGEIYILHISDRSTSR